MNKYDLLIGCLDKKINEANSGMRVASPSIILSLNEAMNIKMACCRGRPTRQGRG